MSITSLHVPSGARLSGRVFTTFCLAAAAACSGSSAGHTDSAATTSGANPRAAAPSAGVAVASRTAAAAPTLVVYKTPQCGCCKGWVKAMESAGFVVEVHDLPDLAATKRAAGVPTELQACHTARIGGYVVEGHVPPEDIRRLLAERPDVAGIATPGMPVGSPGMEGPYKDHYDVLTFGTDGRTSVFASH